MNETEKVIEEIVDVLERQTTIPYDKYSPIKYQPSMGTQSEFREMLLTNAAKCINSLKHLEIEDPNQTKLNLQTP